MFIGGCSGGKRDFAKTFTLDICPSGVERCYAVDQVINTKLMAESHVEVVHLSQSLLVLLGEDLQIPAVELKVIPCIVGFNKLRWS